MSRRRLPFALLRLLVRARRGVRSLARRVAVCCTTLAGASWWAVSTVATTGLAWVAGSAVLLASVLVGALGWLLSGE